MLKVLKIVARDGDTHPFGLAGLQVDLGEAAEFLWRCRHGFRVVTDVELDDLRTVVTAEPLPKATTVGVSVPASAWRSAIRLSGRSMDIRSRPSASYWPGKSRNNTTTLAADAASRAAAMSSGSGGAASRV
jgi:hypothetical protein